MHLEFRIVQYILTGRSFVHCRYKVWGSKYPVLQYFQPKLHDLLKIPLLFEIYYVWAYTWVS